MAEQIEITRLDGVGIAAIMASNGSDPAALAALLGAESLPLSQLWTAAGDGLLIANGPGAWLAVEPDAPPAWGSALARRLASHAAVSDQSGAYVVFRLEGPGARTVLQRGASIDLHPERFAVGSAATTLIAHIGVIIAQIGDGPAYDLAVFRSFEASFRHWLAIAAAAL
ncbi:MAG: sarcosine oxidase subunit gamma [Alphaproteobacteria bacterium]|nr:sarcosine oxidase subunit gamma [Alphaproteobacteria bacterium]